MKLQKPKFANKDKGTSFLKSNLGKLVDENCKLRAQLLEASEKKHQEMTRAIQHSEKNILLKQRIHELKSEVGNIARSR